MHCTSSTPRPKPRILLAETLIGVLAISATWGLSHRGFGLVSELFHLPRSVLAAQKRAHEHTRDAEGESSARPP